MLIIAFLRQEHLERLSAADLLLDTFRYNAGTVCSSFRTYFSLLIIKML